MSDQAGAEPGRGPTRLDLTKGLGIPGLEDVVEIGRGGFSVVFKARQPVFGRDVAVKVITTLIDQRSLDRFDRERRTIGALTGHPNIVTVFSSGETAHGLPYIEMELLSGGSLADQLPAHPFDWRRATELMIKITRAVEAAHAIGVLHRDIKPENILLSGHGEPKLGDFGIARLEGLGNTSTGVVTASIAHAAPEIVEGRTPTVQADIYALGSTLYALINGWPAHVRDTDESVIPVLARVATEPVPDLRVKGVPDALCLVLEQTMAKDPAHRPVTAAAMADALEAAIAAPMAPATWSPTLPVTPPPDPRASLPPVDSPATQALGTPNPRPYDPQPATQALGTPNPRPYDPQPATTAPGTPTPDPHAYAYAHAAAPAVPASPPPRQKRPFVWVALVAVAAVVLAVVGVGVVVARRPSASTSAPDGVTPTSASTPAVSVQQAIPAGVAPKAFRPPGDVRYVVARGNDGLFTSTDGKTFTKRLDGDFRDAAAGPNGWVAVGSFVTASSSDGVTWEVKKSDVIFASIATDGTRWVAVGFSGEYATSVDGVNFESDKLPVDTWLRSVATNGKGWIAAGDRGLFTSADGTSWAQAKVGDLTDFEWVTTDGTTWNAFGNNDQVARSTDGITWTTGVIDSSSSVAEVETAAFGAGVWLGGRSFLWGSDDGSTWNRRKGDPSGSIVRIAFDGQRFVVLSFDGTLYTTQTGDTLETIADKQEAIGTAKGMGVAAAR